jgi:hypothetical protein
MAMHYSYTDLYMSSGGAVLFPARGCVSFGGPRLEVVMIRTFPCVETPGMIDADAGN